MCVNIVCVYLVVVMAVEQVVMDGSSGGRGGCMVVGGGPLVHRRHWTLWHTLPPLGILVVAMRVNPTIVVVRAEPR